MERTVKNVYKLKEARFEHKAGTVVYEFTRHDYGCARTDSHYTKKHHISVTKNKDGDYPFFTVPTDMLELVSD